MRRRVHYTSHACLVADPTAANSDLDYGREVHPRWIACRFANARSLKPERNAYSTRLDDVTCPACIDEYRHAPFIGTEEKAVDLEIRAHQACCAGRGAPLLVPSDVMDQRRRVKGAQALHKLFAPVGEIYDVPGRGYTERHRDALSNVVDVLKSLDDSGMYEALTPAINEYMLAGDILAELESMFARARAVVEGVSNGIQTGNGWSCVVGDDRLVEGLR